MECFTTPFFRRSPSAPSSPPSTATRFYSASPFLSLSLFLSSFLPPFLFRSLFLPHRLSFYLILFSLMSLSLITTTLLLSLPLFSFPLPTPLPSGALVNLAYTYVRSPRCICILRNRPFDFTPGLFDPPSRNLKAAPRPRVLFYTM